MEEFRFDETEEGRLQKNIDLLEEINRLHSEPCHPEAETARKRLVYELLAGINRNTPEQRQRIRDKWFDFLALNSPAESTEQRDQSPPTPAQLFRLVDGMLDQSGQKILNGAKQEGRKATVRGWKKTKDWPKVETWETVRQYVRGRFGYDIGEKNDG